MNKLLATAILATALSAPIAAWASDDVVPADKADAIKALLTKEGYEVRKIKMEDGMFEAYALKNGVKSEIYLDADLKIVKTKAED